MDSFTRALVKLYCTELYKLTPEDYEDCGKCQDYLAKNADTIGSVVRKLDENLEALEDYTAAELGIIFDAMAVIIKVGTNLREDIAKSSK